MASLYQRPGSEKWYIKLYKDGAVHRISTKTTDKKAAQQKLDAILGDVANGKGFQPKATMITFEDLAKMVLTDYENQGFKTLDTAFRRFEMHIIPFFGPMPAIHISSMEIMKYTSRRLAEKASKATVRRELELVRRAFTLGKRAHGIQGPYIEMPKLQNARQGFFEEADFVRVMEAMDNADYKDVLLFAYVTGWRCGEVKHLQRKHVDFEHDCIRLDPGTTKNGDGRVFPMIDILREMLQRRLASPGFGNDPVFTYTVRRKDGTVVGTENRPIGDLQKAFNTACWKAGIPCKTEEWSYINPQSGKTITGTRVLACSRMLHDFRRTAVRNLTTMGIPDQVTMQMTGHRTRAVFDRYRIVSESDIRLGGGKMDTAYGNLTGTDRVVRIASKRKNTKGTVPGTVGKTNRRFR